MFLFTNVNRLLKKDCTIMLHKGKFHMIVRIQKELYNQIMIQTAPV